MRVTNHIDLYDFFFFFKKFLYLLNLTKLINHHLKKKSINHIYRTQI